MASPLARIDVSLDKQGIVGRLFNCQVDTVECRFFISLQSSRVQPFFTVKHGDVAKFRYHVYHQGSNGNDSEQGTSPVQTST
jgi:hypothetical protein